MPVQELLKSPGLVIGDEARANLATSADAVVQANQEVIDIAAAVAQAEAAVSAAQRDLAAAKERVRDGESGEYRTRTALKDTATGVATAIAADPNLNPTAATLYSLLYSDRRPSLEADPDAYMKAAERGRVALSSIMERLQPGEPILHFFAGSITATTANKDSLLVTPSTVSTKTDGRVILEQGSIQLALADASITREAKGLVRVTPESKDVVLLDHYYGSGLEHLEVAASNEQWLVVGTEAISARLAGLEPKEQLIALTALRAAGVTVPVEVGDEIKKGVEEKLVSLLAFMATGATQEVVAYMTTRRDALGSRHSSQVVQDSELTARAKAVDAPSIRHMAGVVGSTKDSLRSQVEFALRARVAEDSNSAYQLGRDIQSLANLGSILDQIFVEPESVQ